MQKTSLAKKLQDTEIAVYQIARSLLPKEVSESKLFALELLVLEIMGTLSFANAENLPEDAKDRLQKIDAGKSLVRELLDQKVSNHVKCYLLSVELARVWVLEYLSSNIKATQ